MNNIAFILDERIYDPMARGVVNVPLHQTIELCRSSHLIPVVVADNVGWASMGTIWHNPAATKTTTEAVMSTWGKWMERNIILFGGVRYAPNIVQDRKIITLFDYIINCPTSPVWIRDRGNLVAISFTKRDSQRMSIYLSGGDNLLVPMDDSCVLDVPTHNE